ncbi:MAG: F0F1 ATP synthase subunit gamma [Alphaproteobacteria bacterium]|nr:F0F1 ATP synthase subunit gamma [Alphaproteobacteria bacterium]
MPSLKDLKNRIDSVKSTRKITSAMKMVAAAKLRRSQEAAEAGRDYTLRMDRMVQSLAASFAGVDGAPELLAGNGADQTHLLVVFTSDRGLCGGFNGSIVRETRRRIADLKSRGKTVKILCVGRKGRDQLKGDHKSLIVDAVTGLGGKSGIQYAEATQLRDKITGMFEAGEFDVCSILFNRFQSAMTQVVTLKQLIPFTASAVNDPGVKAGDEGGLKASYIFEPEEEEILKALLPKNLGVQVFQALLESAASEHGARMTAMDNATRNAGEMIHNLTLTYNRTRQAYITKELIEIISGAEAL